MAINPSVDHSPSARILVADDSSTNRKVFQAVFDGLGMDADFVANGQEAVDAVRDNSYGLVLMDIHMPVMPGDVALAEIQKLKLDDAPAVIAVTADAQPEHVARYQSAGFAGVVAKPLDIPKLLEAIQRLSATYV